MTLQEKGATHRLTLTHQLVFGSVLARVADYEAETEPLYRQVKTEGIVLLDTRIEQLAEGYQKRPAHSAGPCNTRGRTRTDTDCSNGV